MLSVSSVSYYIVRVEEAKVDIYLTEEELQREKNLFAPADMQYEPLKGKACDILAFTEKVAEGYELPEPPPSC